MHCFSGALYIVDNQIYLTCAKFMEHPERAVCVVGKDKKGTSFHTNIPWIAFSSYLNFIVEYEIQHFFSYSKFTVQLQIHVNIEAVMYSELSCHKTQGFSHHHFWRSVPQRKRSVCIGSSWTFVIYCNKYCNIFHFYTFLMKRQKCIFNSCFSKIAHLFGKAVKEIEAKHYSWVHYGSSLRPQLKWEEDSNDISFGILIFLSSSHKTISCVFQASMRRCNYPSWHSFLSLFFFLQLGYTYFVNFVLCFSQNANKGKVCAFVDF